MEAKTTLHYSVIVPVYNGALSLEELCNGITAALTDHSFEIVFVDDASTDKSWKTIQQLKSRHPFITAIQHAQNRGQSVSLCTGFAASKGAFVITMDDDLQYNPADLTLLIQKQKLTGADVVYGVPVKPEQSFFRNSFSAIMKTVGRYAGYNFKGSSFRLMKRNVSMDLVRQNIQQNILLDILFYRAGYKIEHVEVSHFRRKYGKSNYSYFSLFALLLTSFVTHCRLLFLKSKQMK